MRLNGDEDSAMHNPARYVAFLLRSPILGPLSFIWLNSGSFHFGGITSLVRDTCNAAR